MSPSWTGMSWSNSDKVQYLKIRKSSYWTWKLCDLVWPSNQEADFSICSKAWFCDRLFHGHMCKARGSKIRKILEQSQLIGHWLAEIVLDGIWVSHLGWLKHLKYCVYNRICRRADTRWSARIVASLISCYAQVLPFKVSALSFFEDSGSGAAAPADSHI